MKIGIVDIFNYSANISNLSNNSNLFVSEFIQKIYINVNERDNVKNKYEQKEWSSTPITPFSCTHPFLFYIFDKNMKIILYMGRIVNPNLNN